MSCIRQLSRFFIPAGFILLSVAPLLAGTTGKIAGRAIEATTSHGLAGVNVIVVGSTLGAATDANGDYFILNVPPGTYSLRATLIGYAPVTISEVRVLVDLTTHIDFTLHEQAVALGEVVITADRPMIQKDVTASMAALSSEQIARLPVETLQSALAVQSGLVAEAGGDLHLRGGRADEIIYLVDGIRVSDQYAGGINNLNLSHDAIEELQTITGAYNAEYGNALSGIVNVVTKEGSPVYHGSLTTYIGDYMSNETRIFSDIDDFDPFNARNVQGTFSGPLPKTNDRVRFFLSGRLFDDYGYLYGYKRYLVHAPQDTTGRFLDVPITNAADFMKRFNLNESHVQNYQLKLTARATPHLKLEVNTIWNRNDYKEYNHRRRYVPEGLPDYLRHSHLLSLSATYALSKSTLAEFTSSSYYQFHRAWVREDPFDKLFWDIPPLYYSAGYIKSGHSDTWFKRHSRTWTFKGNMSSQITKVHLVKAGFELLRHEFDFEQYVPSVYLVRDPADPVLYLFWEKWKHRPTELALYVQDKIELEDLIINLGVRYDYFEPRADILRELANPFGGAKPAAPSSKWSPRLGVSFPITDKGIMYFSYGHFFQIPNYSQLYTNTHFEIIPTSNNNLLGGGDVKPQQTVSYEVGFKQQITPEWAWRTALYFKNIKNLIGTKLIGTTAAGDEYYKYVNRDYGNVKGVNLELERRHRGLVGLNLNYTYQFAEGKASNPTDEFIAQRSKQPVNEEIVPLDWDQRHTIALSLNVGTPRAWNVGLISRYGSGFPYTPTTERSGERTGSENSARQPSTFTLDAFAEKTFRFGRWRYNLFARVYNLLDRHNELIVYTTTGRARFDINQQESPGTYQEEVPVGRVPSAYFLQPYRFDAPRLVQVGVEVEF